MHLIAETIHIILLLPFNLQIVYFCKQCNRLWIGMWVSMRYFYWAIIRSL